MHSIDILAPEGANGAAKNEAAIDISKVSEALIKELTEAVKANIKKVEEKDGALEEKGGVNEGSNEASNEAKAEGNADNTDNEEV